MVGDHLKQLREVKGISQKQVAQELRIPYNTYRNYEKNVNEPNNEMLVKLALYFNVSADYLLDLNLVDNEKSPPPVKDEREVLKETLMQLDDNSLIELEKFLDYLIWKEEQE